MRDRDQIARMARWAAIGFLLVGGSGLALADLAGRKSRSSAMHADRVEAEPAGASAAGVAKRHRIELSGISALPIERQVDLAYDAVFGRDGRKIKTSGEDTYTYSKGQVVWPDFGPVLIMEGSGEPNPVAFGTLGIAYLRETADEKFEEVRLWPDAVQGSMMGNPPQWKVRRDITDGIVIESVHGGVWQGYACDTTTLTELTPDGPRHLAAFTGYDDTGAKGSSGERYDGAITNVVRNRSFDVQYTGTRPVTEHYIRKGKEFVRVPAPDEEMNESSIPTC